ncbi:MAG: PKD repeat protein, partial [Crocinitomicaceae bacterium]
FVAADFDVVFTNTSTVTSTPTYFWDFGDGNTSTLEDPNHTYAATGTYLVCLTITEACTDSTICNSIVITCVPPTASFTQVSVELDATFSDASTSAGTITDWAWDFGDGNTSTLQNPNHTYLVSGTYTVCLIVTDGCDTNQFCSNVVVVCTAPTANFSQTLASQTATFTDLSTSVGTLTNWAWDFGDAGTSTLQNPVHAYSADGTYTVCLTVTDACDTNEFCFDLVINTIGIDGLNLDGTVALAPNPANGVTWITFSEPTTENLSIVVLNVAGEVILTKEISKQTVNTELNLGTNPSGVYFVRIESENGHSILKLINK